MDHCVPLGANWAIAFSTVRYAIECGMRNAAGAAIKVHHKFRLRSHGRLPRIFRAEKAFHLVTVFSFNRAAKLKGQTIGVAFSGGSQDEAIVCAHKMVFRKVLEMRAHRRAIQARGLSEGADRPWHSGPQPQPRIQNGLCLRNARYVHRAHNRNCKPFNPFSIFVLHVDVSKGQGGKPQAKLPQAVPLFPADRCATKSCKTPEPQLIHALVRYLTSMWEAAATRGRTGPQSNLILDTRFKTLTKGNDQWLKKSLAP
jgi:hypothetical protein